MMTLQEVSEYLRVHEMTLYRWAKRNKIPMFKIGGRWRAKEAMIEKWISEKMKGKKHGHKTLRKTH